jgi:hypothetical protein
MFRKVFPLVLVFALVMLWPVSLAQAISHADSITPTATPTRWLTVTSPNGGEVMTVGDVYQITWQSSPNIDKVSIGYKDCPSCLNWIVTTVPNTGSYAWTVFVGNTTNTQFTIEIIGYQTGVGSTIDDSDAPFTVLQHAVATSTPTNIPTNTSTPSSIPTNIPTGTSTPSSIPTNIPTGTSTPSSTSTNNPTSTDTGIPTSTDTSIPTSTDTSIPTSTDTSIPTSTDTSLPASTDTPTPVPTPSLWLTVTSPNGSEVMTVGDVYQITWQSSSNIDHVWIGYKDCPSCLNWIATNIPNTGSYSWTVSVGNTTNTQFTIEIIGYDTGVGSVTDDSNAPFTVLPAPTPTSTPTNIFTSTPSSTPTITATPTPVPTSPLLWLTVTSPNGGEVLTVGNVYRITWQSSPNIDQVSIGYKSCPSCLDWIAFTAPNTGSYNWTVYVGNTINTQFTIEITGFDTGVGSVTDDSNAPFTVLPAPTPTSTPTNIPTSTPTSTPIPQLGAPILIFPINGVIVSTIRPTFDWRNVSRATSYTIQVSASADFSNLLVNASTTSSSYTPPPSTKFPRGVVLYWRVRALGQISPSDWSSSIFKLK